MIKLRSRFLLSALVAASILFTAAPVLRAADLVITPANVAESHDSTAKHDSGIAGVTIAAGQALYRGTSDQRFYLADADAAAPAYQVVGIALHGATAGQPLKVVTYDPLFTIGAPVVPGDTIWLSNTPGGQTKTAADNITGTHVTVMGVAVSTTQVKLSIVRSDVAKP